MYNHKVHREKALPVLYLLISSFFLQFPSIINLNVGGKLFATRLMTLQRFSDSMLAVMFSGRHTIDKDNDGNYFIDR